MGAELTSSWHEGRIEKDPAPIWRHPAISSLICSTPRKNHALFLAALVISRLARTTSASEDGSRPLLAICFAALNMSAMPATGIITGFHPSAIVPAASTQAEQTPPDKSEGEASARVWGRCTTWEPEKTCRGTQPG